jgi:hypothetical protein
VTASHDTGNGSRYGVIKVSEKNAVTAAARASTSSLFRLEVASIDKRNHLPWVHLDFHHLPLELSPPAKESHPLRRSSRIAHGY